MLEARVAKVEADVDHIKRDLITVQTDVKSLVQSLHETRLDVAIIRERSGHLASRSWVLAVFGSIAVVVVTALTSVGALLAVYAPKLQVLFGTAP
jgi:t-SNARE complex subunit (syntaxin)